MMEMVQADIGLVRVNQEELRLDNPFPSLAADDNTKHSP
jgi:hypothetical protein